MAWFTTDDGRRVNTEWFDKEDQQKYEQIARNKAEADRLNEKLELTGGKHDPEITDSVDDYYLPSQVRAKLDSIHAIKTYKQFQDWLKARGIKVETDLKALEDKQNEEIPTVRDFQQKIATAIETYQTIFGKDALSSLKTIRLYDKDLDTIGEYRFNLKGENDPLAGTIRFRDWNADGHHIYHELAHAMQDSLKPKGSDIIEWTNNLAKSVNIPGTVYSGRSHIGEQNAEYMAEALSYGFAKGNKKGFQFIEDFYQYRRK